MWRVLLRGCTTVYALVRTYWDLAVGPGERRKVRGVGLLIC